MTLWPILWAKTLLSGGFQVFFLLNFIIHFVLTHSKRSSISSSLRMAGVLISLRLRYCCRYCIIWRNEVTNLPHLGAVWLTHNNDLPLSSSSSILRLISLFLAIKKLLLGKSSNNAYQKLSINNKYRKKKYAKVCFDYLLVGCHSWWIVRSIVKTFVWEQCNKINSTCSTDTLARVHYSDGSGCRDCNAGKRWKNH